MLWLTTSCRNHCKKLQEVRAWPFTAIRAWHTLTLKASSLKRSMRVFRQQAPASHGGQAAHGCGDAQVMHAAVKGTRAPPRTWVLQLSRPRFNATADTLAFTVQASPAPVGRALGACPMSVGPSPIQPASLAPVGPALGACPVSVGLPHHSLPGSAKDARPMSASVWTLAGLRWWPCCMMPPASAELGLRAQVLRPGSAPKYPGGAAAYALANADGSLAAEVCSVSTMTTRLQWCCELAMHNVTLAALKVLFDMHPSSSIDSCMCDAPTN